MAAVNELEKSKIMYFTLYANAADVNQRRWLAVEKRKTKDEQDKEASEASKGGTRKVQ